MNDEEPIWEESGVCLHRCIDFPLRHEATGLKVIGTARGRVAVGTEPSSNSAASFIDSANLTLQGQPETVAAASIWLRPEVMLHIQGSTFRLRVLKGSWDRADSMQTGRRRAGWLWTCDAVLLVWSGSRPPRLQTERSVEQAAGERLRWWCWWIGCSCKIGRLHCSCKNARQAQVVSNFVERGFSAGGYVDMARL